LQTLVSIVGGIGLFLLGMAVMTASQALARVDAVALMSRLAHHAWRAVAHIERAAAPRMEIEP
jgi:hypothetical protein